jgi:hypothetical protein
MREQGKVERLRTLYVVVRAKGKAERLRNSMKLRAVANTTNP